MRCSDFLAQYSEFRDGILSGGPRRRFVRHLSCCRRCARYDEVIVCGVSLLRSAEGAEPSPRFRATLARRLAAALLRPEPLFPVPVRFVGSLIVTAAVAVLVIAAVTGDSREVAPLAPPSRPMPMVRANPAPPFVTFADLESPAPFRLTQRFVGDRDDYVTHGLVRVIARDDGR